MKSSLFFVFNWVDWNDTVRCIVASTFVIVTYYSFICVEFLNYFEKSILFLSFYLFTNGQTGFKQCLQPSHIYKFESRLVMSLCALHWQLIHSFNIHGPNSNNNSREKKCAIIYFILVFYKFVMHGEKRDMTWQFGSFIINKYHFKIANNEEANECIVYFVLCCWIFCVLLLAFAFIQHEPPLISSWTEY